MDAIGGYFSLELPRFEEYHKDAVKLNTGRNCLEYILRARGYKKVYLPYYTCEAVMEPITKLGVQFDFYHIDTRFEIRKSFNLKTDEALLYTNYFGLKERYVEQLTAMVGDHLIVDNTQAFYAKPQEDVDTFYSCRKFFGVADGAYLYSDIHLDYNFEQDESWNRMDHLLKRIDLTAEQGFMNFQKADGDLDNQPIRRMSKLTQRIMQSIDYEMVATIRRNNFMQLHKALSHKNKLNLRLENDAVPMVYPFLASNKNLREKLIENRIFIARYWPNVLEWMTNRNLEYCLACQMLPLPIDQRNGDLEMRRIIDLLIN